MWLQAICNFDYSKEGVVMALAEYEKAEIGFIELGAEDVLTASGKIETESTDAGGFGWEEEEEGW